MGLYLILVALCFSMALASIKIIGKSITYGDFLLALLVSLVPFLNALALLFATACLVIDVLSKVSVQKFFNKKLF